MRTNSESTFTVVKVNSDRAARETLKKYPEKSSQMRRDLVLTQGLSLAEHHDNLRETENAYLWSRLLGGGGEI